jgi:hypothetical protein
MSGYEKTGKRILDPKPSFLTVYSNNRRFNLPSEMGIGNRFDRTYSSQVFTGGSVTERPGRNSLAKTGEVKSLIQYSYALPFKEMNITAKIGKGK